MEDLSLHILDIVENSIRAGANRITVVLHEELEKGILNLYIRDNGRGMDEKQKVGGLNPFYTTKESKDFGLGLPLLSQAAENTGGFVNVESELNVGTSIKALFYSKHIDMKPLGDIELTMDLLKASHRDIIFDFKCE